MVHTCFIDRADGFSGLVSNLIVRNSCMVSIGTVESSKKIFLYEGKHISSVSLDQAPYLKNIHKIKIKVNNKLLFYYNYVNPTFLILNIHF